MKDDILKVLEKADGSPFFFIGSGFSRRYLGLEKWDSLLARFARLVIPDNPDFAYKIFENRVNSIQVDPNIPQLAYIADLIETQFNEMWYTAPEFAESRNKHIDDVEDTSPFKLEIANHMESKQILEDASVQHELDLLKQISEKHISGIITTNYDTLIESIFTGFKTYVGQEQLLLEHTEGIGEIYKIHGCCSSPKTIVLCSKDYVSFNERNAYLAAKLMTIFWEHPIIFLGYSITDNNVQSILEAIASCLTGDTLEKLSQRMIFVEWNKNGSPDSIQPYHKEINKKNIPMIQLCINDFSVLYDALLTYKPKNKYPTRLIRRLRNDIYNVVYSKDPVNIMYVNDFDPDVSDTSKIDYVIGVGLENVFGDTGYRMIKSDEIFRDILLNNLTIKNPYISYEKLLTLTIPDLFPSSEPPVYKYLSSLPPDKRTNLPDRIVKYTDRYNNFEGFFCRSIRDKRPRYSNLSIKEISDSNDDIRKTYSQICNLPEDKLPLNELKDLLVATVNNETQMDTSLRRLIRLVDWMEYGKNL